MRCATVVDKCIKTKESPRPTVKFVGGYTTSTDRSKRLSDRPQRTAPTHARDASDPIKKTYFIFYNYAKTIIQPF